MNQQSTRCFKSEQRTPTGGNDVTTLRIISSANQHFETKQLADETMPVYRFGEVFLGPFVLKRIFEGLIVCLLVSFITFTMMNLAADPTLLLLPPEATVQDIEIFRKAMGFDKPLVVQYFIYISRVVRGDFGESFSMGVPSMILVLERLPATIELSVGGMVLALLIAIPLGMLAAIRRNSILDNLALFVAIIGQALPLFWLAIMLIIIFGVKLHLLPISGGGGYSHLILPCVTIATFLIPPIMRLTRSGMLEVLGQDYIRTARAKGLNERRIFFKHAFRNAAVPVITMIGLQFGPLFGGVVVTEAVFAYPGIGSLAISAIRVGDYPIVQATVILLSVIIIFANLSADVLAGYINPIKD